MIQKLITSEVTKKQCSDSGMALVLIVLLIGLFTDNIFFYKISIPVLIVNMIVPNFYYPFAVFWLSLSNILGFFISKILLSIIFYVVVFPVGLIRKLAGKDRLLIRKFKKGNNSVMVVRNYVYSENDIEKPY